MRNRATGNPRPPTHITGNVRRATIRSGRKEMPAPRRALNGANWCRRQLASMDICSPGTRVNECNPCAVCSPTDTRSSTEEERYLRFRCYATWRCSIISTVRHGWNYALAGHVSILVGQDARSFHYCLGDAERGVCAVAVPSGYTRISTPPPSLA